MTQRHEERYKRAMARVTPEREAAAEARAVKGRGFVQLPKDTEDLAKVRKVQCHILGRRYEV